MLCEVKAYLALMDYSELATWYDGYTIGNEKEHTNKILLVGICYDKKSKKHTCKIEKLV